MKPIDDTGIGIFVPYSAVFPSDIQALEAIKSSLTTLDRWDFVLQCGQLIWNILTSWHKDVIAVQKEIVQRFFSGATYPRLLAFERQNRGAFIVVFFRQQLLEAMRWSLVVPTSQRHPDVVPGLPQGEAMLKVILASSEICGKRQAEIFARVEADGSDLESMRRLAAIASKTGTETSYASKTPTLPIARAVRIFGDLLLRHMPSFPSLFHRAVGLDHPDFLAAQSVIWALITSRPERYPAFSVSADLKPNLVTILNAFLASQSVSFEDLVLAMPKELHNPSKEWSLQPLRAKPLVRQPNGGKLFLVPDPKVFIESMTVGPIFSLVDRARRNDAIDAFGHAIEDYAGEIFSNAYPKSAFGITYHQDVNIDLGRLRAGQIDGYLSYGYAAILCEIKASFIADDVAVQQDPERFISEIAEKYVQKSDGSPKAVAQLANAIDLIASRKWLGQNSDLSRVRTIWPLLVVHDEAVDDAFIIHFLAKSLQDRLSPGFQKVSSRIKYGSLIVRALCVLSVDLLELLESSISQISLLKLLEDYDERTPDRMISLHNFLTGSVYSSKLLPNRRLNSLVSGLIAEWKAKYAVQM